MTVVEVALTVAGTVTLFVGLPVLAYLIAGNVAAGVIDARKGLFSPDEKKGAE